MYVLNFIRGFCMALADSVPSISTILLIYGLYTPILNAINKVIKYIL